MTVAKKSPAKKKAATSRKPAAKKAPAKKAAPKKTAAAKPDQADGQKAPGKRGANFDGIGSIRLIAELLGYSDKTIRDHIAKGGPVEARVGRNKAARLSVRKWHEYFLTLASGDGNPLADAKLAKQTEDLRKLKRENDEAEGRLIPADQVNYFFEQILVQFANSLDGIAGKASGGDPAVKAKIQDETRFIRVQIFNDIAEFLRPFSGDSAADLAISEAQQLGMGEREKDSTEGKR